jgi:hypothetical protein
MAAMINADVLDIVESTVLLGADPTKARTWWLGEISRIANEKESAIQDLAITPADVAEIDVGRGDNGRHGANGSGRSATACVASVAQERPGKQHGDQAQGHRGDQHDDGGAAHQIATLSAWSSLATQTAPAGNPDLI